MSFEAEYMNYEQHFYNKINTEFWYNIALFRYILLTSFPDFARVEDGETAVYF